MSGIPFVKANKTLHQASSTLRQAYDQCHGVKDLNNSFFHPSPRPTSNIHSNDAASPKVEISVVQALLFCLTLFLFGV